MFGQAFDHVMGVRDGEGDFQRRNAAFDARFRDLHRLPAVVGADNGDDPGFAQLAGHSMFPYHVRTPFCVIVRAYVSAHFPPP
jgi:hypothetical protein